MIQHYPYGIDDPYKRLPTERVPRDPEPGDEIQVLFHAEAESAFVELEQNSERHCFAAQTFGNGYWSAHLPALASGSYRYNIHAQQDGGRETAGPFELEVGTWFEANQLEAVQTTTDGIILRLGVEDRENPVHLTLSFPTFGACRCDFSTGAPVKAAGLACHLHEADGQLVITADGIELCIDKITLELTAARSGGEILYRGSAALRWLEQSDGYATRLRATFMPQPDEPLYGLGERFTGPNLRGNIWDSRVYEEYKEQGHRTYLPVPFLVSPRGYGLWLDALEPSHFDLRGDTHTLTLEKLPTEGAVMSLCLLVSETPYGVTHTFTNLTGKISVPPKWAFGPWMSANTWNSQAKAEEAIQRTLEEDVPASVLVLEAWSDESTFYIFNDAQYQAKDGSESFRLDDFTFTSKWPDPKGMVDNCHEQGIRVLLWQIPVQKKPDEAHAQQAADEQHMLEQGYAIKNADGSSYRNKGWWFTDGLVMDFTHPEARDWWFAKRRYLLDELGIDGMKTDGGEHLWGRDLRAHDGRRGLELYNAYPELYVDAYHDFVQQQTGGNGVTFSRAGYTGAQRHPAHWAGDENSTWSAFRASILAGLSSSLSGVSIWSWDIGGFSGEIPTVELYLRSTQMACFCPIMQYHSELHDASECRDRSPWNIAERHNDPRALTIYRAYAKLRMRLLDYIYGEAEAMSTEGRPLMRYPGLEHPERHDMLMKDPYSYLFGRDLLVCPVLEKGAQTRNVVLPPGNWIDFWSGATFEGDRRITVLAPLERIPIFVRANSPRLEILLSAAKSFEG